MTFVDICIWLLLTLALVLFCAIICLVCFSPIAYMLYRAVSLVWHSRANLNPRTHRGRWALLGIALSLMFLIGILLASFATRRQEEPIFRNLVAPLNYPRAVVHPSKATSLK